MRAVGYCRVSTEMQASEGVSLEAQRARIAAWCAGCGAALDPADVFADAGLSGKRADNRPGLAAALDAVCAGRGVLVVYSLSRLARSVRDTLAIAERLEGAGADLVSLTESIDTTSAAGKMVFRLLAVLAEFEADLVRERTRGAVAHKRALGERLGQVPIGSRLAPDGRTLEPDPAGLRALDDIRAMRALGLSLRSIAARLDADGVPTKRGGPRWAPSTIAEVLRHGQAATTPDPPAAPAADHRPAPGADPV